MNSQKLALHTTKLRANLACKAAKTTFTLHATVASAVYVTNVNWYGIDRGHELGGLSNCEQHFLLRLHMRSFSAMLIA
jgi:hypothetical protein